jgi:hypothetical protein
MNNFDEELRELITKWRDHPGVALEEIIDTLEAAVEELVEEVNERAG